jgi:DNA-directed RNA polymerase specialized sigma subunit
MPRKKNYLNNKDLYAEMVASLDQDKLTPTAEKMLMLLAEKAINRMKYVNEDDRNDCLQFAMLDLLKYWRNFNPKYPNAFAYFTEIAKRGYAKGWNKIHPTKYKGTISISGHPNDDQSGIYTL